MKRLVVALVLAFAAPEAGKAADFPERVVPSTAIGEDVEVRNVSVDGDSVTGEIVNRSDATLLGVRLVVQYLWLWDDEFRPKDDNPGFTDFLTVDREIPPGGKVPFRFRPSRPPPERDDGRYQVSVRVSEFSRKTVPAARSR